MAKPVRRKAKKASRKIKVKNAAKAKKKAKSPMEHGFIEECMKKNKDKDDAGAYCSAIVDKAKGTTEWRKEK